MVHCSIVGYKKVNNTEITYFNLPKDPQRRKRFLAAISRDKSNLPSNVSVCSNLFEDKYEIYKTGFFTKSLHRLLPHNQISTPRKT